MRIFVLPLLLLFYSLPGVTQEADMIIIEGKVFEQSTKEPLPYANISLQDNSIGTVSNRKGEFRIRIPHRYKSDSLQISFMGYKTVRFKISEIPENFRCYLRENTEFLHEVVVSGFSAQHILGKALERIPDNYADKPYTSKGFYRLTSKRENSYVRLSEAVFEQYHAGSARNNQFRLEKMRAIKDEKALGSLDVGMRPESVFTLDVVNEPDVLDLLNKKGLKHHDFTFEGIYPYHNSEVYVITFDQKDGLKKSAYKGRLYIDTETFAFLQLEIGLSPKGISYHKHGSAAQRALMTLMDINLSTLGSYYSITYRKLENRYYLNRVGLEHSFAVKSTRDHFDFELDNRVDFYISSIETKKARSFDKKEVLAGNQWIENQSAIYDSTFWDTYNILLPDFDFKRVAKAIAANNNANTFKAEIESLLRKYPKDVAGRIDSVLSFYNRKNLFNGNALVEYKGELLFQKSYNNALTNNQPDTRFRIGSTSKTFTSMLIMMLENEGRLRLSDTVGSYIPGFVHGSLTIEHLLTHQSGIPNFNNSEQLVKLYSREYELDELVREFCSDSLEFEPGTQFRYSNSGYVLLSLIAEKASDKAFAQLLKEKIFDPLNMYNTCYGAAADTTKLAVGYLYGKQEPAYFIQNVGGAGGITSTAEDLLKWSQAIDQHTLLPKEKTAALFVPRAGYADWQADYGYGWMLDKFMFKVSKKHRIYYHPGTDNGFYTMFLKQPDEEITIILLNNTGDFPRFEITDLVLNELNF